MSGLYIINTKDKRFQFTVKSEFLQDCPNPEEQEAYDLLVKYKINQYLHNPTGPAVIRHKDNFSEYFINGQRASDEVAEKIAHNSSFSKKLGDLVTE